MNVIQKEAARSRPGGVYGHRERGRRGCPALAERSVKGGCRDSGPGPHRLLPSPFLSMGSKGTEERR